MYYYSYSLKVFRFVLSLLFAPEMFKLNGEGALFKSHSQESELIQLQKLATNPSVSYLFSSYVWINIYEIVSQYLYVYLCVSVPAGVCVGPFMYILKHPRCSLDLVSRQLLATIHFKSQ